MQKILSVAALAISTAYSVEAGIAFGIDDSVIQNLKKVAVPVIVETINEMDFPEMKNDQGYVKDIKINLQIPADYDVNINFDQKDNAVVLDMNHIKGEFSGKFSYWWLYMFPVWGNFKATITGDGASIATTTIMDSQHLTNGKDVLKINMSDFELDIDSDNLDIEVDGTLIADFISFFIWMFKWIIVPIVIGDINSQVPAAINSNINSLVASSNGLISLDFTPFIGEHFVLGMDHSFVAKPTVTDTQLDFFLNGTLFDFEKGEYVPSVGQADLKLNPSTIRTLQIAVSAQVADSFLSTLNRDGVFNFTITNDLFNGTFNLTTSNLKGLLPGLETKYGKDIPVSIGVSTESDPISLFQTGSIGGDVTGDLTFLVDGQADPAASLQWKDIKVVIDVSLTNFVLTVQVNDFEVDDIEVIHSNIGDIDTFSMVNFINFGALIAIPIINEYIPTFDIPHNFNNSLVLQNATFTAGNNFLYVAGSPYVA